MPDDNKPRRLKRKERPPTISDEDSSVDSKGNIRDLIDYDYEDTSEEVVKRSPLGTKEPRASAVAAKRKIRKIMKLTPDSEQSSPHIKVMDVDQESSDDDIVKPKRRVFIEKSNPNVLIPEHKSRAEEMDTDSSSEEELKRSKKDKKQKRDKKEKKKDKKKKRREESSDEDEEDEEDEDYDGEEEEEWTDHEEDETEEPRGRRKNTFDIIISDMLGGGGGDPNKPKKYNMKKEPDSVKRFVELIQKEDEGEEDTIDNDITYFKSLTVEKQTALLRALEVKTSPVDVQVPLKFKILEKVAAKPDLSRIAMAKYNALCNIDPSTSEYYKCSHWISGFTDLPLGVFRDLPVKMEDGPEKCGEFMTKVHKCMETAIFGHEEAKLQIMQFVSSWIANPKANGNVLSIHGPMGTGKTSLIKDGVAKALERPFHFITLGGATDASFLDGHSYTYEGSTWGKIADVLMQSKCMNPIIYFDELDKVSETPKGDEINNLLIHLTDGSQNDRFQDKYFTGIDFDLSRCLFIFSHNNNEKVNPILRDRMYNIKVNGFSMKEKQLIAENYLIVSALKDAGLYEKVSIGKEILQFIIENFTGGEAGVRELKRCIQTIISKLNLLRFYNNPKQVPFSIKDFSLPFTIKKEHVELFLKKKNQLDESVAHLYT
jgi:ATPase family associated with various cellular activities (AAA)